MTVEIWRPIVGYEGLYEISNLARIKSLSKAGSPGEQFLKLGAKDLSTGYSNVQITKSSKPLTKRIHRLVAEAFLVKPEGLHCVNHKDGVKANNLLENLEWVTYSENVKHAYRLGLSKPPIGEIQGNSKLKTVQVLEIIELMKEGVSNKDIASKYQIGSVNISRIRNGKRWAHMNVPSICKFPNYKDLSTDTVEEIKTRLRRKESKLKIQRDMGICRKSMIYKQV